MNEPLVDPPTESTPSAARQVRWGLVASGPPVDAAEFETGQRTVEIVAMWGDDVLHVAHVGPRRDAVVERAPERALDRSALGDESLPVVADDDGRLCVVVPAGATCELTEAGAEPKSLDALAAEGKLVPLAGRDGVTLCPLPDGASARITHDGLTFLVRPTAAARAIGARGRIRLRHVGWIGLSLAVHAAFLTMFYFMPPKSAALSLDDASAQERMIEWLMTPEAVEEPPVTWADDRGTAGDEGARHAGDEGQAGDPEERPTRNRMGIEGPRDNPRPTLAREAVRERMDSITAVGAVRALVGSWNAPTSPYGADQAQGRDAMSALGALFGDQIGANFGHGGLGLRGTGRHAGGNAEGTIGVGRLGTVGCGRPRCEGAGSYGSIALNSDRRPRTPSVQMTRAQVLGGLSQEAIRRVVRQHLAEVRFCYEQALQSNPSLEGRVAVQWIVGSDGRVQSSSLASSTVRNANVESCIVQAVRRWTFPAPEGGVVGVNYPFVLMPGN